MVVLFVAGISAVFSGVSTSFDSSLRFSAVMKDFVAAVIRTAEREGDTAAVEQLRRFDAFSNTTYEGGALLQWLAEPADLERKNSILCGTRGQTSGALELGVLPVDAIEAKVLIAGTQRDNGEYGFAIIANSESSQIAVSN